MNLLNRYAVSLPKGGAQSGVALRHLLQGPLERGDIHVRVNSRRESHMVCEAGRRQLRKEPERRLAMGNRTQMGISAFQSQRHDLFLMLLELGNHLGCQKVLVAAVA